MAENGEKGLETLQVWQKAIALATKVCRDLIPGLPPDEKWGLTAQLRRSVQSVPANIAEGYGRYYYQEGIRFCYIARGSLEETYSHLTLAHRLKYISDETYKDATREIHGLLRMLHGYIQFLKKQKRGATEPGFYAIREELSPYPFDLEYPDTLPVDASDGPDDQLP